MTEGQIVAVVWGPFAIVLGLSGIRFRNELSAAARKRRERQGQKLYPSTQSPMIQAFGGGLFALIGVLVLVSGATGLLR